MMKKSGHKVAVILIFTVTTKERKRLCSFPDLGYSFQKTGEELKLLTKCRLTETKTAAYVFAAKILGESEEVVTLRCLEK